MKLATGFKGYKLAAICWAGGILFLSSLPTTHYSAPFLGVVGVRHALFYGLLSFFIGRSLYPEKRITWHRALGIALFIAVFSAIDEGHQELFRIQGREFSFFDWGADFLGGFVVAFVMWQQEVGDYVLGAGYMRGDVVRLAASNVFNNAVTFLTGLMIAAIVTAESFGVYSVAVNTVMTILPFSELGLGISIVRFYNHYTDEDEKSRALQAGMSIKLVISALLIILSFPLGWLLSSVLSPNHSIVLELALAVICASALGMWSFVRTLYQARQDYKHYAGLTLRYGMIRLFFVAILSAMSANDPIYYLSALFLAGPLGVTAWAFYSLFGQIGFRMGGQIRDEIKTLLSYGKWVLMGSVLYPLSFTLPLFILMRLQGAGATATYALALMFVAVIGPLNDAMRAFILPKVSGFQENLDVHEYIARVMRFAIPYGFGLIVLMSVTATVYELLLRHKYPDGLFAVELLMSASGLAVFGGIINSVAHYFGLPHFDAWINVGRVVFVAITSVIAIPYFGVVGAAIGPAVAAVVGEIVMFVLVSRHLRINVIHGR